MSVLLAALTGFAAGAPGAAAFLRPAPSDLETEFDWVVPAHTEVFFDTNFQLLFDPNVGVLEVENGVMVVNDITIEEGAKVRVLGPNPLRILATGRVTLDGEVDVSGFAAQDVQSLLLAQVPQPGGLGVAGGGDGGIGSPLTSSSSPRGGDGEGMFGVQGKGGQGGESGYAPDNRNWRRPGGGGGGAFGPDQDSGPPGPSTTEPEEGLEAQAGFDGFDSTAPGFESFDPQPTGAFGAETGLIAARGGSSGSTLFVDGRPHNDFWGVALGQNGPVIGELKSLGAGSGGGAGGDAIRGTQFPTPTFIDPSNGLTPFDNKGGAGGGGGGALHLVVLDELMFGPTAKVRSNGGTGGTGESANFLDRLGGGGGGGSGGHVVLESRRIVFEEPAAGAPFIEALGGKGGLGMPIGDNPEGTTEFMEIFDVLQRRVNEGGTGGPGLIQLHVPNSDVGGQEANIELPAGYALEDLTSPDAVVLLPLFLARVPR